MKNRWDYHTYQTEQGMFISLHEKEFSLKDDFGPFETLEEADKVALKEWDRRKMLHCPQTTSNINPVMKTKLADEQIKQLDDLIANTILPALYEDGICEPDMGDVEEIDEEETRYDDVYEDRKNVLYTEALNYLKNNLN